ncbi:C-type lectin domain family 4 member M [Dissostichus eleginoides]|uniref:C-type lectin domain family 4 member M n=1 Tax=Dissostichus eleginoides TaxID=100907 RepID=A0AAD9FCA0_DISEL|nr:C-type lectin domain family 4 member M [Dissostichus eleginoides]
MDTENAGTFDGSYNKLIHQEDISGDELTLYSNQEQEQVSMSVVRPESSLKHYKRLTVSLAVLAVILLAVDIGLGVYYGKFTDGQDTIMDISAEVAKLQAAYDTAIWHRDEAKKQLAREIREQQIAKWELDHQKSRSKDYLKLSDKIQMEIAALKSHIPMIKEGCRHCLPGWTFMNSVCFYFAFSDAFSPRSWQEARQFCINQGGDLAVIDSREKHLAITELITNYQDPSRPIVHSGFWIGLRDIEEEGIWKWLDGTSLTTGYWNDGEPNDSGVVSQQLMIDNVPKLRGGGMWWQNGFWIGLSDVATAGTWVQVNNVTEGETV